jgi:membrane protein
LNPPYLYNIFGFNGYLKYNVLGGDDMPTVDDIRNKIKIHHISAYSGHMAFFMMMSIFPFLVVLLTIIGKLSLDTKFLIEYLSVFVPTDIGSFFEEYITTITFNPTGVISISLILTLWSSSRAVHAMIRALNVVFEVDENRNYLQMRIAGFFYTLILITAIVLFLFLPVVGERLLEYLNPIFMIPLHYIQWYSVLRWVVITVFFFMGIMMIYMKLPNTDISYREAIPGALFSLVGWLMNAVGYSFIITNFSKISFIYGGISAILLLSFWLYINSAIILFGGEVIDYLRSRRLET